MSRYLVNKFLFTIDRDPGLVERYRADPAGTVTWWEAERANLLLSCVAGEASTWLAFTDDERAALRAHDHVEVDLLVGDPSKAEQTLGWHRDIDFPALVQMMVEADMALVHSQLA